MFGRIIVLDDSSRANIIQGFNWRDNGNNDINVAYYCGLGAWNRGLSLAMNGTRPLFAFRKDTLVETRAGIAYFKRTPTTLRYEIIS